MKKVFKKKEPLISIIIPVYKVEKYLEKCISSVINQTYKNLEIILVDDGSPDNCGIICDEYAKKDERIMVVHKKNGGLSDARNAGIRIATGEYIGFVDSDDWIDCNMYKKLYELLKDHDADISVCELQRTTNSVKNIKNTKVKINIYTQKEYMMKFFKIGSQTIEYYATTKLYKRDLIDDKQYPKGLTSEDVLGTCKAILKAKKIVKSNEKLYYYRYNEDSITGKFTNKDLDLLDIWDMVVEYISKNAPEYLEYASINRKRINFTLLYRLAKEYSTDKLQNMEEVKTLLTDLKKAENELLKANIDIKRKILIYLFCRNYLLTSKLIKWK